MNLQVTNEKTLTIRDWLKYNNYVNCFHFLSLYSFILSSIHLLILLTKELFLGKEWLSRAVLSFRVDLSTSADIFGFHSLKREIAVGT